MHSCASQVSQWCNVLYRKFDFDQYPDHVRNLHTYAFKPLIIKVRVWWGTPLTSPLCVCSLPVLASSTSIRVSSS